MPCAVCMLECSFDGSKKSTTLWCLHAQSLCPIDGAISLWIVTRLWPKPHYRFHRCFPRKMASWKIDCINWKLFGGLCGLAEFFNSKLKFNNNRIELDSFQEHMVAWVHYCLMAFVYLLSIWVCILRTNASSQLTWMGCISNGSIFDWRKNILRFIDPKWTLLHLFIALEIQKKKPIKLQIIHIGIQIRRPTVYDKMSLLTSCYEHLAHA